MRNISRLACLAAVSFSVIALAADKVTIAQVLKDPAKYDGKVVTLTGKVMKFKQKTSKAGNPYYNFKLVGKTEEETVNVYGRGTFEKELANETMVSVTGKFVKEKKVGEVTYKNEIDVTKDKNDEKTKEFGVTVVESKG